MALTERQISPDEERIITEITSGILDDSAEETFDEPEIKYDRLVRMDDGKTAWLHDGIFFGHEDIKDNFELIDQMPLGIRNIILSGNEIARYLDWKRVEMKQKERERKIENTKRQRVLIAALTNKKPVRLDEWLGKGEVNQPNHTETDDMDLDWGDAM